MHGCKGNCRYRVGRTGLGLCVSQWEMVAQKMATLRSIAVRAPNITHFDGVG